MLDRQDIDALLVGALYGELTPAEETRLAAHLESHPGDRTVLSDLTRAREIVRDSRILQVQAEPPQSVTALLMQEAARRAPRKAEDAREGWFARFVQSFLAHPAMAAAAMLVVVLGVAVMVTSRQGDHFASSETTSAPSNVMAPAHPAETSPVAAGSAFGGDRGGGEQADLAMERDNAAAPAPDPTSAGDGNKNIVVGNAPVPSRDQYRVTLDEGAAGRAQASDRFGYESEKKEEAPRPRPTVTATKGAKDSRMNGIVLRKPSPEPKELGATSESRLKADLDDDEAQVATGAAPGGGAGVYGTQTRTESVPASPPPPPAKIARDDRAERTAPRAAAPAQDKAADPKLAWARDQHTRLIAQVRAGNCSNAAGLAVDLSNRAPSYYAQNVATDRAVKDCIAYINSEREKDAEVRAERARAAQKRSTKEPARAAPAKPADAKAADSK